MLKLAHAILSQLTHSHWASPSIPAHISLDFSHFIYIILSASYCILCFVHYILRHCVSRRTLNPIDNKNDKNDSRIAFLCIFIYQAFPCQFPPRYNQLIHSGVEESFNGKLYHTHRRLFSINILEILIDLSLYTISKHYSLIRFSSRKANLLNNLCHNGHWLMFRVSFCFIMFGSLSVMVLSKRVFGLNWIFNKWTNLT